MNDVQSLMTAAAMLVMGGFGLFMYKSDEHDEVAFEKSEQNFVPHGGKSPSRRDPPFPPLFPKVDFQKGDVQENPDEDTEIKPKKTRKMRKRGPSGGSIRRF